MRCGWPTKRRWARPFREQRWWLDEIAKYVGVNVAIALDDFADSPFFDRGGLFGVQRVFGDGVSALVENLNSALTG
jgi:hypothetical protein